MIKIETQYDTETDVLTIKRYEHENSCYYEHMGLIERLIQEVEEQTEVTREEILERLNTAIIKELDKEVEEKNE